MSCKEATRSQLPDMDSMIGFGATVDVPPTVLRRATGGLNFNFNCRPEAHPDTKDDHPWTT